MKLGCSLPVADIGTGPSVLRDYAQAAEGLGYAHLVAPDHVLGANPAADHGGRRVGTTANAYHDPFVLFGFLSGCTKTIGFAVGVLILAQRQAVLVAKQAASLDVLCGGRFRLGIGVGWNEVEFIGLNENFHNRGRRSAEQVRVMQALWAEPHVDFTGEFHRIEDAGINPRRLRAACRSGMAGMQRRPSAEPLNTATALCRWPIRRAMPRSRLSRNCGP
jgi:alkanesulfonate monooxygenase SsuD/methylene tetrahydromethanopterin reductase-like flavin-dependent oxidoreductase (luciferase family)